MPDYSAHGYVIGKGGHYFKAGRSRIPAPATLITYFRSSSWISSRTREYPRDSESK